MSPDGDETARIEFDYAWGWFQYHASQRLTAFNFFLVIVGFLLVGYAQAILNRWDAFGVGLGVIGLCISIGFFALDVRNRELVNLGRDALRTLEETIGASLCEGDARPLVSHRFWLRSIIAVIGAGFVVGAIWAGCGYPGTGDDTVSCRTSTVLVLHRPGFDLDLVQRSEQQRDQGGSNHDRGGPGDGLSGYLHVQSVGVGNDKRVKTGRHCGEEPVGRG
jgi:hypothetical protein